MAEMRIETRGNQKAFSAGETVEGSVTWRTDRVTSASIRLCWRTEGKGTQDVGLHAETVFDAPRDMDQRSFKFVLPKGPLSYDGKLIAIIWGLELKVLPGKQIENLDIVVSQ